MSKNLGCADGHFLELPLSEHQLSKLTDHARKQGGISSWKEFVGITGCGLDKVAELVSNGYSVQHQFINLNTCQPNQIDVPKISLSLAQGICEERDKNGQYKSWEDLRARGIPSLGPTKINYLKGYTFTCEPTLSKFVDEVNKLPMEALLKRGLTNEVIEALLAARKDSPFDGSKDLALRLGPVAAHQLSEALYQDKKKRDFDDCKSALGSTEAHESSGDEEHDQSSSEAETENYEVGEAESELDDVTEVHMETEDNQSSVQQSDEAAAEEPKPRGRGRPKGSKNKTKDQGAETGIVAEEPKPRVRGRPKGSKNKTKDQEPQLAPDEAKEVHEGDSVVNEKEEEEKEEEEDSKKEGQEDDHGEASPEPKLNDEYSIDDESLEKGLLPSYPVLDRSWWWLDEAYNGQKPPPFPMEFCCAMTKTDKTYRYEYDHIAPDSNPGKCDGSLFTYHGKSLTLEEVEALRSEWNDKYCSFPQANKHGNGRETVQQRIKGTTTDKIREKMFEDLKELSEYKKIPSPWNKTYRPDPYGNVVCLSADKKSSMCGFQVDHIFPWSRGGLTEPENLVAVFWRANEVTKRDKILDANEDDFVSKMEGGLKVEHFLWLIKKRDKLDRQKAKLFDRHLDGILCTGLPIPWNLVPDMSAEQLYDSLLETKKQADLDLLSNISDNDGQGGSGAFE